MNALSIASTQIRQIDGLYSLNDLHNAEGRNNAKRAINELYDLIGI